MTTNQKTFAVIVVVVLLGAVWFEARQGAIARAETQKLQEQLASLTTQFLKLQQDWSEATNQVSLLREDNERLHHNSGDLLKLRNEVTQLRPLQKDVTTLKTLAKQGAVEREWNTNQLQSVGRATPLDALQTYLWSAFTTNTAEIARSLVGDESDPPNPDALGKFASDPSNHPFPNAETSNIRLLSQTMITSEEVQLEVGRRFGGVGFSAPLTLRNVNGEWRVVVFNSRDADGKVTDLRLIKEP